MFGLSQAEKRRKGFRSTLGTFLKKYPGGLPAAFALFPMLEHEDLKAQPSWSIAKYALVAAKQIIIRTIETSMLPDDKVTVGIELDKLDWGEMRRWALGEMGDLGAPPPANLHPATVYIAMAECVADIFHLGKQYDKNDRDAFTREIIQTLIGMDAQERADIRLRAVLDEFVAGKAEQPDTQ